MMENRTGSSEAVRSDGSTLARFAGATPWTLTKKWARSSWRVTEFGSSFLIEAKSWDSAVGKGWVRLRTNRWALPVQGTTSNVMVRRFPDASSRSR